MPTELLRVCNITAWEAVIIRSCCSGVESEFHFKTPKSQLSVTINDFPNERFLHQLPCIDGLVVIDYSLEDRGWIEGNRFELRIYLSDDDDCYQSIRGSSIGWGTVGEMFSTVLP